MYMDLDFVLKNTTDYEEDVIEDLKRSEYAQVYLETAFEEYEQDGDMDALLLALQHVNKAQGSIKDFIEQRGIRVQLKFHSGAPKRASTREKVGV